MSQEINQIRDCVHGIESSVDDVINRTLAEYAKMGGSRSDEELRAIEWLTTARQTLAWAAESLPADEPTVMAAE